MPNREPTKVFGHPLPNPAPRLTEDQQRYEHLMDIAVSYAIQIDGEWGHGDQTEAQARQEIEDELLVLMARKRIQ